MSELATRQIVRSELRPARVRADGPGNVTAGLTAVSGATVSADGSGTTGVTAAPASREGVVSRYALFGRLAEAERVVQISAPAGSGKTVLMRSWIAEAGLAPRAAWVS